MTAARRLRLAATIALSLGAGCKTRGTIELELAYAMVCEPSSAWSVYAVREHACEACTCGNCFAACEADPDACIVGCDGAPCPADPAAIELAPEPGRWAIVIDMFDSSGRLTASGCHAISIDRDGTEDQTIGLPVTCVPSSSACE